MDTLTEVKKHLEVKVTRDVDLHWDAMIVDVLSNHKRSQERFKRMKGTCAVPASKTRWMRDERPTPR